MLTSEKESIIKSCCHSSSPAPESILRIKFWSYSKIWKSAAFNTLHCLIGCSIGDFGMIIYLQAYHPEMSIVNAMVLAMLAGLMTSIMLETAILKLKESFNWWNSIKTAFHMSFASMIAMELAENATDYWLTGGGNVPLTNVWYWIALIISLGAGFLVPFPYNYYKVKKFGKSCH